MLWKSEMQGGPTKERKAGPDSPSGPVAIGTSRCGFSLREQRQVHWKAMILGPYSLAGDLQLPRVGMPSTAEADLHSELWWRSGEIRGVALLVAATYSHKT